MVHSYGLSAPAQEYLSVAGKIAEQVASANAADVDALARFPVESMTRLAESGLMGLCLSKEFGGQGEGMRTFAAVTEELATACIPPLINGTSNETILSTSSGSHSPSESKRTRPVRAIAATIAPIENT